MERMSPFRHQSIQGLQDRAFDNPFVVDPFDADLHKSLLAGLDPPLEQVKKALAQAAASGNILLCAHSMHCC